MVIYMNEENRTHTTVLDTDYQVIEPAKEQPKVGQGGWISALVLTSLGMTALAFPLVAGTGFTFLITAALFLYGITLGSAFFTHPKNFVVDGRWQMG